jgi:hypothetical protein
VPISSDNCDWPNPAHFSPSVSWVLPAFFGGAKCCQNMKNKIKKGNVLSQDSKNFPKKSQNLEKKSQCLDSDFTLVAFL